MSKQILSRGDQYDQETFEVMRRILRPDSCCVDGGAHSGKILQEMVGMAPSGTHFAFEPLPYLAAYLRRRFPSVRIYEAAISDYRGRATFVHVENDPAYSGLQPRLYDRSDPVLREIHVNVVRLDDVIPEQQPVAFIKLDLEGGEFHALQGAVRTIYRSRPIIVFEAGSTSTGQYGVGPEEIYQLITRQLGYCLSTMQRWLNRRPPYSQSEFGQNWLDGPDFYFIAYPAEALPGISPLPG